MARAVLSVAASHARNPVARFGAIKPSKAHIVTSTLPSRKRSTRTSSRAAFIQASYSYYEETEYKPPPQWPDKDFITEVLDRFPDEGVCNVEEGVVLFKEGGYIFLDIRSKRLRDLGEVAGSVSVPWQVDTKRFVDGKMVIDSKDNDNWLDDLKKAIPSTEAKIMVCDMDGRTHAVDCLEVLFENGYENIVGLKGGFKAWFRTFDYKLRRRVFGEYAENYSANDRLGSGDSCGVHASGAGFENQDRMSGEFWDSF